MLQSCVVIDVPLHCVYDFHRYQGADVPDVISNGRLMHAGDVHSITAESEFVFSYARDHPSKYSRYVNRNLPTADGKCHLWLQRTVDKVQI